MSSESRPANMSTTDSRGLLEGHLISTGSLHPEKPLVRSSLHRLGRLLAWLGFCALPLACAQPAPAAGPAAVGTITLERQCFGCPSGERLELGADGRARLTRLGQARHGTVDVVSEGRLAPGEFERLARAVVAAGFFSMAERYEAEGLQDGAWAQLTVTRGGVARVVFRREDAGPKALADLLAALDAAQARVRFVPLTR